ncbi:MAG: geranylgeranylglyceryl/heptaprenylglyceryl phosphate synthase [Nitrososphaeraceae archaeon]
MKIVKFGISIFHCSYTNEYSCGAYLILTSIRSKHVGCYTSSYISGNFHNSYIINLAIGLIELAPDRSNDERKTKFRYAGYGTKHEVENYISSEIKKHGTLCFALIDSESFLSNPTNVSKLEQIGISALLVGGSSVTDQLELTQIVSNVKSQTKIPVILFPGNITGVCPAADAILFSSLLNSDNPYFITEAQALGALSVKKYNIEPLPTGYLIIGEGTTAWFVGRARGVPHDKSGIAVMYSLAAQYLGMRFLYLEAGSGAKQGVQPQMVAAVRKNYGGILIVGGGIRDAATASEIARAGADIIVIGTMIEKEPNWELKLSSILGAIVKDG